MPQEPLTSEAILTRLKRCGVPTANLSLIVGEEQVVISGCVDTFYSLQLIQSQLRSMAGDRKLIQNVSVPRDDEGHTPRPTRNPAASRTRPCFVTLRKPFRYPLGLDA